jgi:hypothetical protein
MTRDTSPASEREKGQLCTCMNRKKKVVQVTERSSSVDGNSYTCRSFGRHDEKKSVYSIRDDRR